MELDRKTLKYKERTPNHTHYKVRADKARADFVTWTNLIGQARTLKKLFSKACKEKVKSDAESAFDKLDEDAADYCKEHTKVMNAMITGRNCCDRIATAMAKSITQAMWDRLKESGQREFGSAGNLRSKESWLGKIVNRDWCDCGEWANLVRNSHSSGFSLTLLRECADHLPKQWDMYRGENTDHPHNWTRFCWGNHCVDVDPWKEGHADGSVSSGASFDRATASGEDERTAEWAE